jgi:hypothetical protein
MAMRDGDLPAAFFASVDSRIWRDDSRIMKIIKFAAVIERQQSQKFIGRHLSFKLGLSSMSDKDEDGFQERSYQRCEHRRFAVRSVD